MKEAIEGYLAQKGYEGLELEKLSRETANQVAAIQLHERSLDGDMPKLKLTERDRTKLCRVLEQLIRGQEFIMRDKTVVAVKTSIAGGDDAYVNPKGVQILSIDKHIGSELAILHSGITELRRLLS